MGEDVIPDAVDTVSVGLIDAVHHLSPQRIKDENIFLLAGRRQDLPVRVKLKVENSPGRAYGNFLSDKSTLPLLRSCVSCDVVIWIITVFKILFRFPSFFPTKEIIFTRRYKRVSLVPGTIY